MCMTGKIIDKYSHNLSKFRLIAMSVWFPYRPMAQTQPQPKWQEWKLFPLMLMRMAVLAWMIWQKKLKSMPMTWVRNIWMLHWRHTMLDGAEFWISCQRLKLLRKDGHWQLIQNSVPSTIMWRQCDIRMLMYFVGQDEQGKISWILIPKDVFWEISDFWFPGIWSQFLDFKIRWASCIWRPGK